MSEESNDIEIDQNLITIGNLLRFTFTSVGTLHKILTHAKENNFCNSSWDYVEDRKNMIKALEVIQSKSIEEFAILENDHWIGSFTKK